MTSALAKTASIALLLVLALTGCGNPNGDSNPTRQQDQLPIPSSS